MYKNKKLTVKMNSKFNQLKKKNKFHKNQIWYLKKEEKIHCHKIQENSILWTLK